jgi:hypothetical protein
LLVSAAASGELASGEAAGGEAAGGGGGRAEPLAADEELAAQAASLAAVLGTADVPPEALVRAVIAWTQLFGMISFELFGQFVGSFDPPDAFFAHAVAQFAAFVGLR